MFSVQVLIFNFQFLSFAAFEEEGEEHLVESPGYVDRDIFYPVLHGTLAQGGEGFGHLTPVGFGHLTGLEFELLPAFEVDEEVRAGVIVEVDLMGEVVGVEDDDFVFVVAEVTEGVEEGFLFLGTDERVCEEDDEGASVELFGGEVDGVRE